MRPLSEARDVFAHPMAFGHNIISLLLLFANCVKFDLLYSVAGDPQVALFLSQKKAFGLSHGLSRLPSVPRLAPNVWYCNFEAFWFPFKEGEHLI